MLAERRDDHVALLYRAEDADMSTHACATLARSCYFPQVSKGSATRFAVLGVATEIASRKGLAGLTIGSLASRVEMSKSGLFAHFQSKESLQLQVLAFARESWIDLVVRPALSAPRGEPRVRVLVEHWLAAGRRGDPGCLFVSAATEFDDQPGPVRDQLVRDHRDFMDSIHMMVTAAITHGDFRSDVDAEQFAHDLWGAMLAFFYASRLLEDPAAETRTRRAVDALVAASRASAPPA